MDQKRPVERKEVGWEDGRMGRGKRLFNCHGHSAVLLWIWSVGFKNDDNKNIQLRNAFVVVAGKFPSPPSFSTSPPPPSESINPDAGVELRCGSQLQSFQWDGEGGGGKEWERGREKGGERGGGLQIDGAFNRVLPNYFQLRVCLQHRGRRRRIRRRRRRRRGGGGGGERRGDLACWKLTVWRQQVHLRPIDAEPERGRVVKVGQRVGGASGPAPHAWAWNTKLIGNRWRNKSFTPSALIRWPISRPVSTYHCRPQPQKRRWHTHKENVARRDEWRCGGGGRGKPNNIGRRAKNNRWQTHAHWHTRRICICLYVIIAAICHRMT